MKKTIFAVLTAMAAFALAGCGKDETDKALERFVPAEFSEKPNKYGNDKYKVGDIYYCNAKEFLEKTGGYLGKQGTEFEYDEKKYNATGIKLDIPSEAEEVYINVGVVKFSYTKQGDDFKDIDRRTKKLKEWHSEIIDMENPKEQSNFNDVILYNKDTGEGAIVGTFGTLDGKKVLVDKKNKMIFYKYEK